MKKLKPSHREKKRYLLIDGKNADEKSIEKAILNYVGVLGYGKASPKIITKNNKGLILAINRGSLNNIRAAFLLEGKIQVKKVSGSLKKLK